VTAQFWGGLAIGAGGVVLAYLGLLGWIDSQRQRRFDRLRPYETALEHQSRPLVAKPTKPHPTPYDWHQDAS